LDRVQEYFADSEKARWYANSGPCSQLLSARVGERLRVEHVLPTANCTLALELVLRAVACDSSPSRRLVLVPSYTFVATASAAISAGLQPMFIDVEDQGWHADPGAIDEGLRANQGRVAALLACSTFGTPPPAAQLLAWREAADRYDVPLIIDAAAGFGAWMPSEGGTPEAEHQVADAVAYSMHATKPFAVGEGGLLVTRSSRLAELTRRLANFGFDEVRRVTVLGTNGKLDELTCAMALCALDDLDAVVARRRATARLISTPCTSLGMRLQVGEERATWQAVYLQAASPAQRDAVLRACAADGIEARSYFSDPLHLERSFAGFPRHGNLDVTARLASGALALPMANDLSPREVERIVSAVATGAYQAPDGPPRAPR
jgi:dTDP-4-amino-4,6-dideoxygalactose transaminase